MVRCPRGLDSRGERMELDGKVPKGAGSPWREDGAGWDLTSKAGMLPDQQGC